MLRPSPLPSPTSLVVKNGSTACASTSDDIPVPLSVTASTTYSPGPGPSTPASGSRSRVAFDTSIASRPPLGMASRALTARFRMALSSWPGSAWTRHESRPGSTVTSMVSPRVRRRRPVMPPARTPASIVRGRRAWRREKASSFPVRSAPNSAARAISSNISSRVSGSSRWSLTNSLLPRMTARRLLKSWAMPPVSWPTTSIFWDWWSWSSSVLRSVMSCTTPVVRTKRPASSSSGSAISRITCSPPSARTIRYSTW